MQTQRSEQPVLLIGDPGGEIDVVRRRTDCQSPQPFDLDLLVAEVHELSTVIAEQIEGADPSCAKFADQNIPAIRAEVRWSDCHSPWSIQLPSGCKLLDECPGGIEHR